MGKETRVLLAAVAAGTYYLKRLGKEVELVQAAERPKAERAEDGRLYEITGPFADEAQAREGFDRLSRHYRVGTLSLKGGR